MDEKADLVCSHCGEKQSVGDRYCPNCGSPFFGQDATNRRTEGLTKLPLHTIPIRRTESATHRGLLAIIVIALILVVAVWSRRPSSSQSAPQPSVIAPSESTTSTQTSSVPFVGCKSDGQTGPVDAPFGKSRVVNVDASEAQKLAYYQSDNEFGVLAPRGWYCFGTYGSDGVSLYVSPNKISGTELFSDKWHGFVGPVIQLSTESGDTSGRFGVAKVIARIFPTHKDFVASVIAEGIEPASSFPSGPYPKDILTYRSNELVEYQTPAETDGLGTNSNLQPDVNPISGVAMLMAEDSDSDLLQLSVRLLPQQSELAAAIVQQVERDALDQAKHISSVVVSQNKAASSVSPPPSSVSMGYPVPEEAFVEAYVIANKGQDDLDDDQLSDLAHHEYQLGKQIDTQTLLLGGDLLNTRGKRARDYLDKLYRQYHPK